MSACTCDESTRAPRYRRWLVVRRNSRCSAFEGYRHAWSPYSDVRCEKCGAYWRTKAKFVSLLKDEK